MPNRKRKRLSADKLRAVHYESYIKELGRLREQEQEDPRPKIRRRIHKLEKKLKDAM